MSITRSLLSWLKQIAFLVSGGGSLFGFAGYVAELNNMYRNHVDILWKHLFDNIVAAVFVLLSVILSTCYPYIRNCRYKVIISCIYIVNFCLCCLSLLTFCVNECFRRDASPFVIPVLALYGTVALSIGGFYLNQLQSQLNIARAANTELRESVNTLKSESESQNDELSARMNTMNAMSEEITRLKQLKSQLSIACAANTELRESVNTLKSESESQNDELSTRMNGMSEEITRLKNKNTEIQQKYDNLQVDHGEIVEEHKELEMNFKELQLICDERLNKSEYYTWNARDVVDWIVSLDKSRYNKYYDILLKNMKTEGINGHCLGDLERNDLHRLGMTQFTDKRDVYDAIQQLIANRQHIGNKPAEGLNDTAYLHK